MNITKLKNQARLFICGAVLAVIAFLSYLLASAFTYGLSEITPGSLLLSMPSLALTVLTILHALLLLRSVAKEETPFLGKNIRHLQWIGWTFVAYEPISYLFQVITNRYFPIVLWDGIHMTTVDTYGGVFLICGFVILAISTVFRYGMELQQLSDETL